MSVGGSLQMPTKWGSILRGVQVSNELRRWLLPPISSPGDARPLVRRCWGGWYVSAATLINSAWGLYDAAINHKTIDAAVGVAIWLLLAILLPLCAYRLFAKCGLASAFILLSIVMSGSFRKIGA